MIYQQVFNHYKNIKLISDTSANTRPLRKHKVNKLEISKWSSITKRTKLRSDKTRCAQALEKNKVNT